MTVLKSILFQQPGKNCIYMPFPSRNGGRPKTPLVEKGQTGLQDPGPRTKALVAKHGVGAIMRAMRDEKYLADTFSAYDGMLIIGLGNALKGSGDERERMLNRMFGKVPDKQINLNINVDVTPDQLSDKAKALLAKLDDGVSE